MLPPGVTLILLSATAPNVQEFASWLARTRQHNVFVVSTARRPVPLEHYLYIPGKQNAKSGGGAPGANLTALEKVGLFRIYDAKSQWHSVGHKRAVLYAQGKLGEEESTRRNDAGSDRGKGRQGGQRARGRATSGRQQHQTNPGRGTSGGKNREQTQWRELVHVLKGQELLPVAIFTFSKKKCDDICDSLGGLNLNDNSERYQVQSFVKRALACLRGSDRELPQVLRLEECLSRGLGVHHAGILPIMKEVVEMLFCRGLVKVLFCTETFAMGVNAPTKCVVFSGLRKHDGQNFRLLLPGEYTQMAGRAGRRGLDSVGTVISFCPPGKGFLDGPEVPSESDMRNLLTGLATKLESKFHLRYNMILNLLRIEDLKVDDMLKRSFAEFHSQKSSSHQLESLKEREEALRKIELSRNSVECLFGEPAIEDYFQRHVDIQNLQEMLYTHISSSKAYHGSLSQGRVVLIRYSWQANSLFLKKEKKNNNIIWCKSSTEVPLLLLQNQVNRLDRWASVCRWF